MSVHSPTDPSTGDDAPRQAADALARALDAAVAGADGERGGLVLAVTGAGVSAPSGIATFRGSDPGAVWRHHDVSIATEAYFHSDPAGQWRWYLDRFDRVRTAEPNPAHHALVEIERWAGERGGGFLLVTQNVDPLHERAGQRNLVKVHGTSGRFRCSREGCRLGAPAGSIPGDRVDLGAFRTDPSAENLPTCPECGALLRAHVLLFDEYYQGHRDYGFERVMAAAAEASLLLFVGTSLAVGVTELLLRQAWLREIPVLLLDPAGRRQGVPEWVTLLQAPAEEALPAVVALLR